MKRTIIGLLVGGIGGIALGFAVGIFIYPFWFLNDVATEKLANRDQKTVIANGTFIHADPSDRVHYGKGSVTLYRNADGSTVVFLNKDFEVGPGPAFHVYLADAAEILSEADFEAAGKRDLGRLRAFRGSQVYPVDQDIVVADYQSVVIWCKEFGALISPAAIAVSETSALRAGVSEQG